MGPVIDETWTLVQDEGDDEVAHARAMLAAQAPAMARLLLKLSVELKDDTDWSSELCGAFESIGEVLKAAGVKP